MPRYRYRIRVNGNGVFSVQRKRFVGWHDWKDGQDYYDHWRDWLSSGDRYADSASACAALLRAQAYDEIERKHNEWVTLISE